MIITTPFTNGSYVKKNIGYDNGRITDHSTSGTYSYPGSYELGEEIIRPMPIQKGDGVHALPWAWNKYTLKNKDVFIDSQSGGYHGHPQFNRTFSRNAKINVAPRLVVSRNMPHTVPGLPHSLIELVKSSAILKAQANLNKQVASLPLLFVERKATLKTAKSYATFILNNAITMQRKDVKKWMKALKRHKRPEQMKRLAQQIANRHLEFVFGVLPLLSEIEDSIEHFSKPVVTVRTGRGRDRRTIEKEQYGQHLVIYDGAMRRFPVRGTVVTTTVADFSSRCDLRCEITSQVMNNASLLGFNPLYTWYDMTPLSFVVGWFSNFNTWVQALDPLVGLEYVTGSSSHKDSRTVRRYMDRVVAGANRYRIPETQEYSATPSRTEACSATYDRFVREVHSTMPGIQSLRVVDRTSFFTYAASVSLSIQRLVRNAEREIEVKSFRYRGKKPRFLKSIKYKRVKI